MGCKSSRPQVRPMHPMIAHHRGPQDAPSPHNSQHRTQSSFGVSEEDTGYANPHQEPTGRDSRSRRFPAKALSPHASDDDLVLVCAECGAEIEHCDEGEYCPVSGKRHT